MIDIGRILKRAWHILWNYKILWVFGVLIAITAGSQGGGGNGGNGGSGSGFQFNSGSLPPGTNPDIARFLENATNWFQTHIDPIFLHPEGYITLFIWIGAGLLLLILVSAVVTALIRYPSETAVLRMVDEYEKSSVKLGFRQGWRKGWSRAAFRLWLIDLLVLGLPTLAFLLIMSGLGAATYFSAVSSNRTTGAMGLVAAIGSMLVVVFAFIVLMIFVGLLRQFFMRMVALDNLDVGQSIRMGWEMFKRNWQGAVLMWLVILGLGIAYFLVSLVLVILLIPVFLILLVPGLIVAAIPALVTFGLVHLFLSGPLTWIIAILVGLPFLFLVAGSPLLLIGGWVQIYSSSVWTLTYREMKALENLTPAQAQAVS